MSREHRYTHPDTLADALAAELQQLLGVALREHGEASLVVSGGRTPVALFQRLRELRLDWSRVKITLADERWVEPHEAASNEALVRRELLQDHAAAAQFIPLKNAAATAQQGADLAWRALSLMSRPFDAVLLGMGDDGHTASLFPGSPGILEALDPQATPGCVAMSAPVAPNARLSLNLAALAQTQRLFIHFSGESKWRIYERALELGTATRGAASRGDELRELATLPVSAVLRLHSARPQVYWSP